MLKDNKHVDDVLLNYTDYKEECKFQLQEFFDKEKERRNIKFDFESFCIEKYKEYLIICGAGNLNNYIWFEQFQVVIDEVAPEEVDAHMNELFERITGQI